MKSAPFNRSVIKPKIPSIVYDNFGLILCIFTVAVSDPSDSFTGVISGRILLFSV
jgi:hypothetical protein